MNAQHLRRSKRYEFQAPIDVSLDARPVSFGTLIDISKDGLGFRASPTLNVGETYLVSIRDFASLTCRVLHCTNFNRYGAIILMSDGRKRKLAQKLEQLPQ